MTKRGQGGIPEVPETGVLKAQVGGSVPIWTARQVQEPPELWEHPGELVSTGSDEATEAVSAGATQRLVRFLELADEPRRHALD